MPRVASRAHGPLSESMRRPARYILKESRVSTKYVVKRQDDHGNVFEVKSFDDRDQADKFCKELTAKGHKQMYWVKGISEAQASE